MKNNFYVGWIKTEINGCWEPRCQALTTRDCNDLLKKLKRKGKWSTSIILPNGETPYCSVQMLPREDS